MITTDLTTALAADDAAEDAGTLAADDRGTCHTCRTWATPEHLDSPGHLRAVGIPAGWRYDTDLGVYGPGATR